MNAAIRAVVRTGISRGYEVYGVRRGYNGILHHEMDLLKYEDVSEKLQHGGTFLFTARSAEFREVEGKKKAAEICKEMGIETLIVIGGDGSFTGAKNLSKFGVNIIGLTRGRDTKFHHTEKLDKGEVYIAQFTEVTSAIKINGAAEIYTKHGKLMSDER